MSMFYCFIVSVQDTFGYALKFWMPPRAIVETAASAQISTIVLERPRLSHSVFISTTKAYTSNRHCVSRSLRESHFNTIVEIAVEKLRCVIRSSPARQLYSSEYSSLSSVEVPESHT
jgi:hypothetical protein